MLYVLGVGLIINALLSMLFRNKSESERLVHGVAVGNGFFILIVGALYLINIPMF